MLIHMFVQNPEIKFVEATSYQKGHVTFFYFEDNIKKQSKSEIGT